MYTYTHFLPDCCSYAHTHTHTHTHTCAHTHMHTSLMAVIPAVFVMIALTASTQGAIDKPARQ